MRLPVGVEGLRALIKYILENHGELVNTGVEEVRNEDECVTQKLVGALFHVLIQVPAMRIQH